MAILRITNCDFHPLENKCVLSVDVFYPEDNEKEPRTYIVIANNSDIMTYDTMQHFIEKDILSQRIATPNWGGVSWKSTRV